MGGVWKYVLGGYLLFVLLGAVASGSFMFLLLLLVVAAIVLARRTSGASTFRLSWTSGRIPELGAGPLAGLQPDPHRFDGVLRALEGRFPEDPLDSPQMVEILSAYTNEPDEAGRAIEDEYRSFRRRFLDWRARVETLTEGVGAEPVRLEAEAAELRRFVESLDRRAEESRDLLARALDETGRAEDAVTRARSAYAKLAADDREQALTTQLDEAEKKLRLARQALAKDAERPVTALALCAETVSGAQAVERRSRELVELPRELEERRSRFTSERARTEQRLARVKDDFQAAAQMYAPSCWLEVRGVGAAADRALERARARWASASADLEAGRIAAAATELDDAFGSLNRAFELAGKIEAHLAALEAAALGGRERIAEAEKAIDKVWSSGSGPTREPLQRASELVERARAEIGKEQPDWLSVVELATRALELAGGNTALASAADADDTGLARLLEDAKERAKAARDSAWAWAIVSPTLSDATTAEIDSAEVAFQAALRLEAAIPGSGARTERTRAVNHAVDAFRSAERAAAAASNTAESERSRRPADGAVGMSPQHAASGSAEALVWGALGLAAMLADH